MPKIGMQAFMLRSVPQDKPFLETLRKVHEVGYRSVELVGNDMFNTSLEELLRAKDEFGMEYSATSANVEALAGFGDSLRADFDKIVHETTAVGAKFIRIPMAPLPALVTLEAWLDYTRTVNQFAVQLKDHGIQLTYHNHHVEFVKFGADTAMQVMRDNAPDLRFEIDVHWVHRGGVDPVAFLNDFSGLVDLIHLKDFRIGKFPEHALHSLEQGDMATFGGAFYGLTEFAEVGEGTLDFKAIIDTAIAQGATELIVEQDDTYGRDVFESLKISRDNLIALGYGDLF